MFWTVVGPAQCQQCLEDDQASCSQSQTTQKCSDDKDSLGTIHCGSATIKYRDYTGNVKDGVITCCIDCAGKFNCLLNGTLSLENYSKFR